MVNSLLNGYKYVYKPEHHRAFSNGVVYEHILVAEEKLGRKLNNFETVHHLDENKLNNNPDNLIVFRTSGDHTAFHNGSKIYRIDDVYVAEDNTKFCPICGNIKSNKGLLCRDCRNNIKQKESKIPNKVELEKLLLQMSISDIGRKFEVSHTTVRRWIKKYNLRP